VSQQEQVVLNVQTLIPSQSEVGLSLESVKQLQHLRIALAEYSLAMLGEQCAEKTRQARARERMTSAEKALEEFLRCAPEPNSTEEKWMSVGLTLEQVVLEQLSAVDSQSQDIETNAYCLHLRGRFFRMLAVLEDPLSLCALWDCHRQVGPNAKPCSDPEVSFMERGASKMEADKVSDGKKPSVTSAKSEDLQQNRCRAQELLSDASQALAEAISLCLQHKLPATILADASLTMVECHGQWDPVLAGQHLALFQSCCTASAMADVLSCACADTSTSQLSALFNLHKNVSVLQKERSSKMIKEVEDFLSRLSKSSTLFTISPNHSNILAKLPSNLKILLLQHSKDGSELYGAFFEKDNGNHNGKNVNDKDLACSRGAKVSVCPQALQALREQCVAFSHEKSQGFHEEAGDDKPQNNVFEETFEASFKSVVQHMEDYMNPLLSQFDFCFSRPQDGSSTSSESSKTTERERTSPAKVCVYVWMCSPTEPENQYLVLLADMMLMDLPLEALSVLRDDSLCSLSRDFSLQLLHSRLRDQPQKVCILKQLQVTPKRRSRVEKRLRGRKIKTPELVLPSNTFPVDLQNFKYIVDPNNKGIFKGTSLSLWMQQVLDKHHQLTHAWKGFLGSQRKPSQSEVEQLLCTCSGFLYLGMEHFGTTIPPAKIAALNMSECRVALLFDLTHN
uniref:Uncharacterized protein n=1 Tax=Tetraodon nigroviridis TaxID=99883 RepID=H3BXP5_TETNG